MTTYTITDYEGMVKVEGLLDSKFKSDIDALLFDAPIPEEFNYDANIKYLYYKGNKLVGLVAYKITKAGNELIPMIIHIIGHPSFSNTRKGYRFLCDTFKDIKLKYSFVIANIPNDREYMIKFAKRFGFVEYSEDDYGKFYWLDLNKIKET